MRNLLFAVLYFLIFNLAGCSSYEDEKLVISLSNWVGYTPLHYIHEKNIMSDKVKFLTTKSMLENVKMFQCGLTGGFCGTQYEFQHSNILSSQSVPAILLDKSVGGDAVLSNYSVEDLRNMLNINVYLELQSINSFIFDSFLKKFKLNEKIFLLHNKNQQVIAKLDIEKHPTVIVSYAPYINNLKNKGYKVLTTTKDMDVVVIDGIFVRKSQYEKFKPVLKELKLNIDKALKVLKDDPRAYYETIKIHLGNVSYRDFLESLNGIKWINPAKDKNLFKQIQENQISTKWVIK